MKIGEVAKKAAVNIQTVHYYERVGILKPKLRLDSGYRIYDESAVQIIKFVKHAQELGFSLEEIKGLLALRASTKSKCKSVQARATVQLESVKLKISKLEVIRETLKDLITNCKNQKTDNSCPILECLEDSEFRLG